MVELTPSFELEFQPIDRDHQYLLEIINKVIKSIDDGKPEECEHLVPDFVAFAKKHFQREEEFLKKVGFPNVQWHVDHHLELNVQMEAMLRLAENASTNKLAQENLRKELVFFLMDDVINADLEFKTYLDDQGLTGNK